MKIKFLIVAILATSVLMTGCDGKTKKNKTEQTASVAMNVDELLALAEENANKAVDLEGVCTHICQHGGRKIFLMGSDDTKVIRVEASDKIGAFKPECVNSIIHVKGILVEERIDENYLLNWERDLAAKVEETHGEKGEGGCATEQKARGEAVSSSAKERIAQFRKRIAERQEKEGKAYLSFYRIDASNYEIK